MRVNMPTGIIFANIKQNIHIYVQQNRSICDPESKFHRSCEAAGEIR